jgi:hypothetical protein
MTGICPACTMLLRNLADRVLCLEAGLSAPLSHADRLIAKELDRKRHEPHEEALARLEAFQEALSRLGVLEPDRGEQRGT